ncbi:antibiotic biosynthesis monooxygenase [Deinococcus sp.]|uniref:antibiotic biosynthesis monooxygenase n=1 Tax=Deinococcus sp. TaxID=47478 RepID=UPI003CC66C39
MRVHYIEGRGSELRGQLSALLRALSGLPGCLRADLLSAPEQPELTLLESRWRDAPPALELPPGCKAWAFVVEESWPEG